MTEQTTDVRSATAARPRLDTGTLHYLGEWLLHSAKTAPLTYTEFLSWVDEDTLAEWVNGEIVMTSPASNQHQDIADFLTTILRAYIQARNLGVVRSAPFQMKLRNGREPDLLFVKQEHLDRLKPTHLDGPADLVIEIVSPESVGRDRGEKFYEYAQGGIPEYWLIDPQRQQAEFYELQADYYTLRFSGHAGRYDALTIPGFWLDIAWLWQTPLPSPVRVLAEIVGMDAAVAEAFEKALQGK
ncbi:MAG: Uma2 family endonuclease [Anaerolineae bacterium]